MSIEHMERTQNESRTTEPVGYMVVLAVGAVLSMWLGYAGYPVPRADDDFYKSPAVELATNGRLTIPCVRGFLPHAENIFASYPQGYQLLLSGWYLVFGFSLYSSLAFSYTIHLINALCITAVTGRLLQDNVDLSRSSRNIIMMATGLIHIANIAYFDRPEETALIFVWLEILFVGNLVTRPILPGALASGILLGMAALIAPWIGVLGAMVVSLRCVFSVLRSQEPGLRNWQHQSIHLGAAGLSAAAIALAWYLLMNRWYPGVVQEQFSVVIEFVKEVQLRGTLLDKLVTFLRTLLFNPNHILITALTIAFFPVFALGRGWRQTNPLSLALYVAAILSIVFCGLTRPSVYTYLGASQMLLLPCFGPAISRFLPSSEHWTKRVLGYAMLLACVLYAHGGVAKLCHRSLQLPAAERPRAAFSRLREIIPADASVATTSRHWYAFQGRNQWLDAYWCSLTDPPETLKCQWLVLYRGKGTPEFIDQYELVEEVSSQAHRDETYAFTVYRKIDSDQ